MKVGVFVTGTDTGVGKTLIAAALVHGFAQRGFAAAGMKPVAAGCTRHAGALVSDDVEQLCAAANVILPRHLVNPCAFEPPLAPHIAAQQAGQGIVLETILTAFRQAQSSVDALVVEGVGGFRVPLNAMQDTADLAAMLNLPVLLVVGMRLGCLSHALLTVEAILGRGLTLAGWVANGIDPEMTAVEQNIEALDARIPAPCLGKIGYLRYGEYATVSKKMDLAGLLRQLAIK